MKICCALALAFALPVVASADLDSILSSASGSDDRDANAIVLAAGADSNTEDDEGSTSLHYAAHYGRVAAIGAFVAIGVDPGTKSRSGRTSLHEAATRGGIDAIDALAAADSPPSTTSASGSGEATNWPRRRFRIFRLKDSHGFNEFTLIYNTRQVAVEGMRMSMRVRLSLTRRECNAHVLDRFNAEMARLIRDFTRRHHAGLDSSEYLMMDLVIQIDGSHYIWSDDVRTGRSFLHLPEEIHRMTWEEKFNCSREQESGNSP